MLTDIVLTVVVLAALGLSVEVWGSPMSPEEVECPVSVEDAVRYCFAECLKEECLPVGIRFQLEEKDGPVCVCNCPPPPKEENPKIEV